MSEEDEDVQNEEGDEEVRLFENFLLKVLGLNSIALEVARFIILILSRPSPN